MEKERDGRMGVKKGIGDGEETEGGRVNKRDGGSMRERQRERDRDKERRKRKLKRKGKQVSEDKR